MSKVRVFPAILACTVIALPVAVAAQTAATVTDEQALCVAAPELPSCVAGAPAPGEDQSVEVGSDQKVMRLVSLSAPASAPRAAAAASSSSRPAYVAPSTSTRSGPRLVTPTRGAGPATTRMRPAPLVATAGSDMVVTFRSGKADLTDQALANLRVYARALKSPVVAERRYVVEGHTDSVGNAAANRILSQRRAESVVAALISEGVPATRLEARGFGAAKLRYPGRPADGGNRRVELVKSK
jgi:OmpA-OmpF porin, OOP family